MGKRIDLLDITAAVENMLLAVPTLNLGSYWASGFDKNALKKRDKNNRAGRTSSNLTTSFHVIIIVDFLCVQLIGYRSNIEF